MKRRTDGAAAFDVVAPAPEKHRPWRAKPTDLEKFLAETEPSANPKPTKSELKKRAKNALNLTTPPTDAEHPEKYTPPTFWQTCRKSIPKIVIKLTTSWIRRRFKP